VKEEQHVTGATGQNTPNKKPADNPVVVPSGVTLRESGTLVVYREALSSLERLYGTVWRSLRWSRAAIFSIRRR
jgi:hypothetical protein